MSRKNHCSNDTQFQPARTSVVRDKYMQRACTIARLSPCSLWPFSFSLKSIDAKMAGQQHLGLFLFLFEPFGAWFYEENGQKEKMKYTSFPFGMYTKPTAGRPQCPVSYPDNFSASHLFTSVFHQSAISLFRCASARPSCGFVILAVLHWYGLGVLPLSLLGGQQYSLEQRLSQHWQTNGCAVHGFSKFSVPFECLLLLLQYFARRIIW